MSSESESTAQESSASQSENHSETPQPETQPSETKTLLTIHSAYSHQEHSASLQKHSASHQEHPASETSADYFIDGNLGHAWLEVRQVNEKGEALKTETLGTWNWNPPNYDPERSSQEGSGMFVNAELNRPSDVSRTTELSPEQQQALQQAVEEYREKGADGWSYREPCSHFASDVWERATGEHLRDGWISTPRGLGNSIREANDGKERGYREATPEDPEKQSRVEGFTESKPEAERELTTQKLR